MRFATSSLPGAFRRLVSRISAERDGLAALEFAYIAPVLLLMAFGLVEIARALDISRHYNTVTATVADLAAREQSLTNADLDGIMQSVAVGMQPYSIVGSGQAQTPLLNLSVIQVSADPANVNTTKVTWSYAYNGHSVPGVCSTYTVAPGLISAGGSAILVSANYSFQPLLTGSNSPLVHATWTSQATNAPRNACVKFGNQTSCALATICP